MSTAPKRRTKSEQEKTKSIFLLKEVGNFANNPATKGQDTDYKNESGCDGTPRANVSQVVLQTDNNACADYWTKDGAHATKQCH